MAHSSSPRPAKRPRGPYAKITCQACRKQKAKCTLPSTVEPSRAPLPSLDRCEQCKKAGTDCVPWRDEEEQPAGRIQPPRLGDRARALVATATASPAPAASASHLEQASLQDLDDSSVFTPFDSHDGAPRGRSRVHGPRARDVKIENFLPGMGSFLLRYNRFGIRRDVVINDDLPSLDQILDDVDVREVEHHLESVRLFFPKTTSFSVVVATYQANPHQLPSQLLLATLLWLALPALKHSPIDWETSLATAIKELATDILLDHSGRDEDAAFASMAPQALELVFCYNPFALGRRPRRRTEGNAPVLLGRELLQGACHLVGEEQDGRADSRAYWTALSQTTPTRRNAGLHSPSTATVLQDFGRICLGHRLHLVDLIKDYEGKVEAVDARLGEDEPTDHLANALQGILNDFNAEVTSLRKSLRYELAGRSYHHAPDAREAQARRCVTAHFEQLTLCLSLNFASYITATNFRLTSVALEKELIAKAVHQSRSSVASLLAFVGNFTARCYARSLALTPLVAELTDVQWAVPTTERAAILCAITMRSLQNMAGRIFFARRRSNDDGDGKPEELDEMIVLLEAAGRSATRAGARGRETIDAAVERGDVLATAGVLAETAACVFKRWRDRLYEELPRSLDSGTSEGAEAAQSVDLDELLRMPGWSEGEQQTDELFAMLFASAQG